ncbi:GGDEF domain-containing protein [Breoghania sp.]|uniref:GGDEF domain-containing protein n=1 Tax=Breoghania sp. TaxID=2065378 RepID=UPI0029C9E4A8|nr:GGDEF domain-containing protein [Breoghania sp.]
MRLDIFTILVLTAIICFVAAAGFGIAWWRHRSYSAPGIAMLTFGLGGIGASLLAARGQIPDGLSVDVGNSVTFAAMGLGWNAFRFGDGRKILVTPLVVAVGSWLILCRTPFFAENISFRTAYASLTFAAFSAGYCFEFWRAPSVRPMIRNLLLASSGINVILFVGRAIYCLMTGEPSGLLEGDNWLAVTILAPAVFLTVLALCGLWLWQERMFCDLQSAVEHDPLTGVLNRRAFDTAATALIDRAAAKGEELALLLIDIDHFKSVNDRFGHLAGDHVLRAFADGIKSELRKNDLLARYGGEEFVIILRGAGMEDAAQVAEKLRQKVSSLRLDWQGTPVSLTASFGIATTSDTRMSLFELIDRADQGLYGAKGAGRNRVSTIAPAKPAFSAKRRATKRRGSLPASVS